MKYIGTFPCGEIIMATYCTFLRRKNQRTHLDTIQNHMSRCSKTFTLQIKISLIVSYYLFISQKEKKRRKNQKR